MTGILEKLKKVLPAFQKMILSTQLSPEEIMTFHTPAARTDIYKGSFFPQTIRDWNALPDSIITSVEGAEDGVARFTSLVRSRD